jgi:predicted nucleotidyltransferase
MGSSTPELSLSQLCRSPERVSILQTVLHLQTFTVSQVATRTGVSKGMVSRYLSLLTGEGYLERSGRTFRLRETPAIIAIRRLLNIFELCRAILLPPWAEGVGVYGSFGTGTNNAESDIDLWVFAGTPPRSEDAGQYQRSAREKLQREIHLLVLTPERVRQIRESDPVFYSSLIASMTVIGGKSFVQP